MARTPQVSVQPLAALFGHMSFEKEPTILPNGLLNCNANPWALQFSEDLQALRVSDDWDDLLSETDGNILDLLRHEKFGELDPTVLRAHFRTHIEEYREEKKRGNEEGG
eukprot:8845449-Pyramimonas_sp.AAC.1